MLARRLRRDDRPSTRRDRARRAAPSRKISRRVCSVKLELYGMCVMASFPELSFEGQSFAQLVYVMFDDKDDRNGERIMRSQNRDRFMLKLAIFNEPVTR